MNTGIFFDLDGTLWDSAEKVVESWNETFKNENIDIVITIEDMQGVMGKLMNEIADILISKVPAPERYELLGRCMEYENEVVRREGGILFENVEKVLSELSKKYKLFIISNCQKGYIEAFLDHYDLWKYITDTENPGVTGRPKGENITLVAKRNDINQIIYVGDTLGDYNATCDANGIFIHAKYGFGEVPAAKYILNDITELENVIEEIINS